MAKAKSRTFVSATLKGSYRIPNSVDGNPRFSINTVEERFRTADDAAVNYEVEAITGGVWDMETRLLCTFELDDNGKIIGIEVNGNA